MKHQLTSKEQAQACRDYADVMHNLSLHENGNDKGTYPYEGEAKGYYFGLFVATINAIMKRYDATWYASMASMAGILPKDHISLIQLLPISWQDAVGNDGKIRIEYCLNKCK